MEGAASARREAAAAALQVDGEEGGGEGQEAALRQLLDVVRLAVREEHRQLRSEWAETERRLLEQSTRLADRAVSQQTSQLCGSVEAELRRLLASGQLASAGQPSGLSAPQPRGDPRRRLLQPDDSTKTGGSGDITPNPDVTPLALSRKLHLPARAVRSQPRCLDASPQAAPSLPEEDGGDSCAVSIHHPLTPTFQTAAGTPAAYCTPVDGSPGKFAREDTHESEIRSEENERFRRQWHNHVSSRLSRRLTGMHEGLSRRISERLGVRDRSRSELSRPAMPSRLERIVDSHAFQTLCGFVIVANAIFIGIQTDFTTKSALAIPPRTNPEWFGWCGNVFVGIFIAEVVLRMIAKRWQFLCGNDWRWNVSDVMLAALSVVEECAQGFNLSYTRLVRGFHMVRVLRVIRVMRFFRELRLMVCSILQSLISLSWALVLLLLIIYLFSICFMHAATIYLLEDKHQDARPQLVDSYGSVGTTMFSLLMAVSGGVDWTSLVQPLAEISVFYQVLFAFYVLFVITGVLNVLTGAFVQRACEFSKLDRDLVVQSEMNSHHAFLGAMKGIFEEVDADSTGRITWQKFREYLQNEHAQAYFSAHQLDTSDARELFLLLDVDEDEEVGIEDFILGCKRLRGQARSSDVQTLLRESKRMGQKNVRAMRKVEAQLTNIFGALRNSAACVWPGDSSAVNGQRSPKPRTPGSMRSRCTPIGSLLARSQTTLGSSPSPSPSPTARQRHLGAHNSERALSVVASNKSLRI